jgi:DNA-binding transcriptional LysR family regulator
MSRAHRVFAAARPFEGLDLNLLVALDALLTAGSVSEAARRCQVTQSAMSRSLSKLRAQLGDELLVRTPSGMALTPRARTLAQPLARALYELRSVVRSGSTFEPATARCLFTIGTYDEPVMLLFPGLMRRLQREAPFIQVVVRPLPAVLGQALEEEQIDLAITVRPDLRATLVAQKLYDVRYVCVLRRGHPALRDSPGKLDLEAFVSLSHVQVAAVALTMGGFGTPPWSSFVDDFLERMGKTRHVVLRVPGFLTVPFVVAQSDLVATLPESAARIFADSHDLRIVEPPEPFPRERMYQVWHQRRQHDPAHAWFREVLGGVPPLRPR